MTRSSEKDISGIPRKRKRSTPGRGRLGRPPRISREAVLGAAMELLDSTTVEDFTMKAVAQRLGTVSMAIYNYFSSREDLLMAVADEVCLLFESPPPAATWQEFLHSWLRSLKIHADRFPVMASIIGLNGHASSGWVRMTAPVAALMRDDLGLQGERLATAVYLFTTTSISMVRVIHASAEYLSPGAFPDTDSLVSLNRREQEALRDIGKHLPAIREEQLFDALFEQLINGIEVLAHKPSQTAPRPD